MNMDSEIKQINYLIAMAEINGADSGGSYKQNYETLKEAMELYLASHGLNYEYKVEEAEVEYKGWWSILQFVKVIPVSDRAYEF